MYRSLFLLIAIIAAPCVASAQKCRSMKMPAKDAVVGSYAGQKVTLTKVDEAIGDDLCKAKLEYDRKIAELRQEALDRIIDQGLLQKEAKAKGHASVQALMKAEVHDKLKPPTEKRMKAEYDRAKDQLEGATYDQVKEQIRAFLTRSSFEKAIDAYMAKLRNGSVVVNDLPVYRVTVSTSGPSRGAKNAKVVIVEYADYECPYCGKGSEVMTEVIKKYPKDVRVVFKDFPLDFHKNAVPAAVGARCAGLQGKYWEMHDELFKFTDQLSSEKIIAIAKSVKLDMKKYSACTADPKHAAAVQAEQTEAAQYGVEGTPAFFVNGIPVSGAQPLSAFSQIIDRELRGSK